MHVIPNKSVQLSQGICIVTHCFQPAPTVPSTPGSIRHGLETFLAVTPGGGGPMAISGERPGRPLNILHLPGQPPHKKDRSAPKMSKMLRLRNFIFTEQILD